MSPEMHPKSLGTFEKWAPVADSYYAIYWANMKLLLLVLPIFAIIFFDTP